MSNHSIGRKPADSSATNVQGGTCQEVDTGLLEERSSKLMAAKYPFAFAIKVTCNLEDSFKGLMEAKPRLQMMRK